MKVIILDDKDKVEGNYIIRTSGIVRSLHERYLIPNSAAEELDKLGIGYREVSLKKFQKDWARLYNQGNLDINTLSETEIELKSKGRNGYEKPDNFALRLFQERLLHQSLESYKIQECGHVDNWVWVRVLSENPPEETFIKEDVETSAAGLDLEYDIIFTRHMQ
jgi:hypothetical protein